MNKKMNLLQIFKEKASVIYAKYIMNDSTNEEIIENLPIFYIGGSQTLPPPLLPEEEECEIKILGIVMTMVSERTTTTKLLKNDLAESEYAKYLFKTEIHRGQSIENSVFVNLPVIINEPSSKQAREYRDLSREIQERIRRDNREEN